MAARADAIRREREIQERANQAAFAHLMHLLAHPASLEIYFDHLIEDFGADAEYIADCFDTMWQRWKDDES